MPFPQIDSPCPVRWSAMPTPGRDFCTLCERRVHNLDGMTAAARRAFIAGCSGPVCVAYTLRRRMPAATGLGLIAAMALAPAPAVADEAPAPLQSPVLQADPLGLQPAPSADCSEDDAAADLELIALVGGVLATGAVQWADAAAIAVPELPAIAEDGLLDGDVAAFVAAPDAAR